MSDLQERTGTFINGREQKLHTYAYVPIGAIKSVLFFHHGFGEYSGRAGMPEVFRSWARAGIAVHTYDAHGHGRSEPDHVDDRFLIWDFNHIVDDYVAFTKDVKAGYDAKLPVFIGGHSMGSLASIHVALRDQTAWDGLVLGTATVDVEWNWILRMQASVGSLLAMLIPRAEIVPTSPATVTADDELAAEIVADPLLAVNNVRARTANEMLRAFAHVQQFGHLLWLPIYCHHGTADHLASITAVKSLLDRCASADITFHQIQGGAHELYVGMESQLVTEYVIQWIDRQLSSDASSEASLPMQHSASMISLSGNPFDWHPKCASVCSSIYGGSPLGTSPVGSPRAIGPKATPFTDNSLLWQELDSSVRA